MLIFYWLKFWRSAVLAAFKWLALVAAGIIFSACSQPDMLDSEGRGLYLSKLNQNWLLVNYWATWCSPCIAEIPELNALAQEAASRFTILGVNFDQVEGEVLDKQVLRMKIQFPVVEGAAHDMLKIDLPLVLPTTYIFAPGGVLHGTLVGPQTRESLLLAMQDAQTHTQ